MTHATDTSAHDFNTTPRSDVEYLFDTSQYERDVLPGLEVQAPWLVEERQDGSVELLKSAYTPAELLGGFDRAELEEGWELVQLHELIACTFHEMIATEPLHHIRGAALAWQTRLLHSEEALALIQSGCEWLQGVIDAVDAALAGTPTLWVPGKRGQLSDPRCAIGRWIKAHNARNRVRHVRKRDALSCEVLDPATGLSEVMPAHEARMQYTLLNYA